jgi:CBS domain-containing protein
MRIKDIMNETDRDLITVGPDETARAASEILTSNNIGAVVVCDGAGRMIGILSERDIVHGLSERGSDVSRVAVAELMTAEVVTCGPGDDVGDTMSMMNAHHIRHLPVLVDGRPAAMVSSRDLMEALLEETEKQRDIFANAYEMVR